jgi:hypothetical protein
MVAIRGVKIESVNIKVNPEEDKIEGYYLLMSTSDKILAKQGFNGYSDIKVDFSRETKDAYTKFMEGLTKDVQSVLGLTEEAK